MPELGAGPIRPPFRPPVIPRGRRPNGSSSLPIDKLIVPMLHRRSAGLVRIFAPPGGGKTTALSYLRLFLAEFPNPCCFEAGEEEEALTASKNSLAILACTTVDPKIHSLADFELCPWTMDDCLEYLAAMHRDHVASVLSRLSADSSVPILQGSPALLAFVMDHMAADPSVISSRQALIQLIARLKIPRPLAKRLHIFCANQQLETEARTQGSSRLDQLDLSTPMLTWFHHAAVQRLFLAESIARRLARRKIPSFLKSMSARGMFSDISSSLPLHPGATETLDRLIEETPKDAAVPAAASILLLSNPDWRPANGGRLNLRFAVLRSARWARIDLEDACLIGADLTGADLSEASLSRARGYRVQMARANLRGAKLDYAKFSQADVNGADLSGVVGCRANFSRADFTSSILSAADLSNASFSNAIFKNCDLQFAKLCSCVLEDTELEGANLSNADLTAAWLRRVVMHTAQWNQVRFHDAKILACDLEGLEILGAEFTGADLTGSLLTASRMPGARFDGAYLVRTGLAEIDWEDAILCDADLTHASFHMGSSRSGLVGSTIPCEGSKTGFYTDEFNEQDFKSPEEIRKACLAGADLRGAKLDETDFYLVDLRRAKYSAGQRDHFVRCGAILVTRGE